MKRNMKKIASAIMALLLMLSCVAAMAEDEKETVYILADALGIPERIMMNGNDCDESLPFTVNFRYELDGQELAPADLAGKSGHLVITVDYTTNLTGEAEVKGEKVDMPIPLLAVTFLPLDTEVYSNVEVTNGKVMEAGRMNAVVCVGLPGLSEALNISGYEDIDLDFSIPAGAVISADVTDFKSEGGYTIVTGLPEHAGLPFSFDPAEYSRQLHDAMAQLMDGADQLATGAEELAAGAEELHTGAVTLSDGLNQLDSNSGALMDGADQMIAAIMESVNESLHSSAVSFASAGIELHTLTLDNFEEEIDRLEAEYLAVVEASVREQADATLTEQVTAAAREQVSQKVTEAVRSHVRETVAAAVEEQVTAEVEVAMPGMVREQVTEAIRTQVTENVTAAVSEQISEQLRASGVKEEDIPVGLTARLEEEQTQAVIEQQVAEQMASVDIQAMIEAQTAKHLSSENAPAELEAAIRNQMESDGVQELIESQTDSAMQGEDVQTTIQQQIVEQMASDEVTALINENIEAQRQSETYIAGVQQALDVNGAQSEIYLALESLRGQLEGVKAFRDGLAAYTSGVNQASDGANALAGTETDPDDETGTTGSGSAKLAEGALTLSAGMAQLREGLSAFDQDAVQKVTGYLDGSVHEILDRVNAVLALHYEGYMGESAVSTVFIIRSEGIQ